MSRSLAEIEFELKRELYTQQVTRRDAVRSTLAVPLAIVSFAAFGFNGLRLSLSLEWSLPILQFLSAAGLAMALLSGFFFIWALRCGFRFDYNPVIPQPEITDLEQQERNVIDDLKPRDFGLDEIQRLSRDATWKALSREYDLRTRELDARNTANLDIQSEMLVRLLIGLGLLIAAIVLFNVVAVLSSEYFEFDTAQGAVSLICGRIAPILFT